MPLAPYFAFVGAVLLMLLFAADAYLPKLPAVARANADSPIIRIHIHSDRKWPERVVYDTSLPTIIPAQIANSDAGAAAPATVVDVPAPAQVRAAFAQLQPSSTSKLPPSHAKKPEKTQPNRKVAKRYAPPLVRLAQWPHFGFFTRRIW